MSRIIADISISVDGFVTAANQTADEPLGAGGEQLHDWFFRGDERDQEVAAAATEVASFGAVVAGRRTYDHSLPGWAADGPTGSARLPVIVLTHEPPAEVPENGVYQFVDGGVSPAARAARAAAGEKDIVVIGGADIIRQFLAAGLVDELSLHVTPVLFGDGTRLFEGLTPINIKLTSVVQGAAATHLTYQIASANRAA